MIPISQEFRSIFLHGEPLTSMDFDFEFLKQVIDGITAEEISAKFKAVDD